MRSPGCGGTRDASAGDGGLKRRMNGMAGIIVDGRGHGGNVRLAISAKSSAAAELSL